MEKQHLERHIEDLYDIFLKLKTKQECKAFLEDLCTYKEVEQMALRAYAAKLFLTGKTYAEIIEETEVSSATLSRVSRAITHGSGGYRAILGEDGHE